MACFSLSNEFICCTIPLLFHPLSRLFTIVVMKAIIKHFIRIAQDFYWQGMKASIQAFVQQCLVCQRHKAEHLHPAGLLQHLSVPLQIWSDISMDFVEGLPTSQGKSVLLVVVDRFSKYAHLLPLTHPYTTVSVARLFFDNIFKLHGLPKTILSDRDVTFTVCFGLNYFG